MNNEEIASEYLWRHAEFCQCNEGCECSAALHNKQIRAAIEKANGQFMSNETDREAIAREAAEKIDARYNDADPRPPNLQWTTGIILAVAEKAFSNAWVNHHGQTSGDPRPSRQEWTPEFISRRFVEFGAAILAKDINAALADASDSAWWQAKINEVRNQLFESEQQLTAEREKGFREAARIYKPARDEDRTALLQAQAALEQLATQTVEPRSAKVAADALAKVKE